MLRVFRCARTASALRAAAPCLQRLSALPRALPSMQLAAPLGARTLAAAAKQRAGDDIHVPEPLSQVSTMIFNDHVMRDVLPKDTYKALQDCRLKGTNLSREHQDTLALAMQNWAMERGCVNFAHWFSAARGTHAEKHDGFIEVNFATGQFAHGFNGTKLFHGEADGSSFPSGGLRATHRAAAYTAWDINSSPFVRADTLYIPAAFVAWTGEALDDKTPLLRSLEAVNEHGLRLLRAIGDKAAQRVIVNNGWEQEFFVVDRDMYLRRPDLIATGRTLLGAPPKRGQQTEAHYLGRIPLRVRDFLRDVQKELWALGQSLNCYHNEVAPSQHELSPVFTMASISADQNALALEVLQDVAFRHALVVLIHEKPFQGLNGSGKHNNWGLNTDTGANLFKPGSSPDDQRRFATFVAALTRTIHVHGDLLRIGTASPGNDFRLGMQEAPPAIISLYTGETMEKHLRKIVQGGPLEGYNTTSNNTLEFGTKSVLPIQRAQEDRNRTAPFPFCGNRFEFRACGSSANIAWPLALLNTAMADSMSVLAQQIENGKSQRDAVAEMLNTHFTAIFNGNGYSAEWRAEATRRGLWNLATTPDAVEQLKSEKNMNLLSSMGVLNKHSISARAESMYGQYIEVNMIEAATQLDMLTTGVIPAIIADVDTTRKQLGDKISHGGLSKYLAEKQHALEAVVDTTQALKAVIAEAHHKEDAPKPEQAIFVRDRVKPAMMKARQAADAAELLVSAEKWPFAKYDEILYSHHADGEQ